MWFGKFVARSLLVVALISFALPYGMKFGSRWDSQHNPTKGVTVVLEDEQQITGDLITDWDGTYILTNKDGAHPFKDFKMMTVPRQDRDSVMPWRFIAPLFLILVLSGIVMIPIELYLSRRGKRGDK